MIEDAVPPSLILRSLYDSSGISAGSTLLYRITSSHFRRVVPLILKWNHKILKSFNNAL